MPQQWVADTTVVRLSLDNVELDDMETYDICNKAAEISPFHLASPIIINIHLPSVHKDCTSRHVGLIITRAVPTFLGL